MSTETTDTITPPTPVLAVGDWEVDPSRSRVHFATRAFFGLSPVSGRFERFEGGLHVDTDGRAQGSLRIEAASIKTGISLRDAHLRRKDFFHARQAPHVVFELDALERVGDGYQVRGTLQIRDKRLPIDTRAVVERDGEEIRISARFPIDHGAAGLRWAKPGMVPGTVDADIELALVGSDAA